MDVCMFVSNYVYLYVPMHVCMCEWALALRLLFETCELVFTCLYTEGKYFVWRQACAVRYNLYKYIQIAQVYDSTIR